MEVELVDLRQAHNWAKKHDETNNTCSPQLQFEAFAEVWARENYFTDIFDNS
jgi:hypothetical protein